MHLTEIFSPSYVGRGGFAKIMRCTYFISAGAAFLMFYQRSTRKFIFRFILAYSSSSELQNEYSQLSSEIANNGYTSVVRFYGMKENAREVEKDMREMVDKVKKGEPLYGVSTLTPYMQGVAARNSRYSGVWLYNVPYFNFVNHPQVCSIPSRLPASGM